MASLDNELAKSVTLPEWHDEPKGTPQLCLKIDKEVVLEDKPCILVSKPNLLGIRWFRSIWACCYYYYGSLMLKCLPCVSLRCVCTCFLLISNGVIFYLPFLRSFLHFDLISTHCSSLLPSFYKCYFFFFGGRFAPSIISYPAVCKHAGSLISVPPQSFLMMTSKTTERETS